MLLVGGTPFLRGQTVTLTLEEARRIAFDRNWDLLAAKSNIDSATAQLIIAKEFPNPTASLTTAKIGQQQAGTIAGNSLWNRSYDTIAAVSQLVEIAGKRHDRQDAARAGLFGATARFIDAKRSLDQGVTKAYLAALLADENYRILNESTEYLKKETDIAQHRFEIGDLSDSDKKQLEIAYEQFDLQTKAAKAASVQARIAVEILLGIKKPQGDWKADDSLAKLVKVSPPSVLRKPGSERPDVLAAESDLRAAKANLKLQKAYRIPDPTFSVGTEHEPPGGGPSTNTWNMGVSFPLPLWNLNGGNIKAAEASVDQMALALGKIQAQAYADVASATVEYGEAHNRFLKLRDSTSYKSAFTRDAVGFAFEHGGASLVDFLEAERTDNTVRQAVAQAMSDTASAIADLAAAQTAVTKAEIIVRK